LKVENPKEGLRKLEMGTQAQGTHPKWGFPGKYWGTLEEKIGQKVS